MHQKLLILVIGMMAMFLAATTFAAEHKSGTENDKKGSQMEEKSQTQMDKKSQSKMQEKSGMQKATTGMGEGEQFAAENLKNVEDLKGKKVMDANGENIGKVNSMLVDSQSGKVRYIMLTSGGVFGVGGEDYLIPWQALRTGPEQEGFQVNLTSEELKDAPKGGKVTSSDQAKELNEFYDVSPEREESGHMGSEAGTKKMDKESHEYEKKDEDKKEKY